MALLEDQPFNIYQEQLSFLDHGLALWDPRPVKGLYKQPGHVSIGDVGYLDNGTFMRMFNVTLPWDHPSNKLLGKTPDKYKRIEIELVYLDNASGARSVRDTEIHPGEIYVHQSRVDDVRANTHEDSLGQMNQWAQYRGALLSLPYGGSRKDVIDTKMFQNCFKENVKKWFRWSKKLGLAVESIEDLILVTGRTLVTSWGIGAFEVRIPVDSDLTTIFPKARTLDGSRGFFCRNSYGNVEYHNSRFHLDVQEPLPQNQCVFIGGLRAKRTLFRTIRVRVV